MLFECSMKFAENDILTKEMLQHIYDDSLLLTKSLLTNVELAIVSGIKIYNDKNGDAKISNGVMIVDKKMFVHCDEFVIERKNLKKDQHYRVCVKKNKEKYSFQIEEDNEQKCENVVYRFLFDNIGDIIKIPGSIAELIRENVYLDVFDMPYCDLQGNYICNPVIASCLLKTLDSKQKKSFQEMYIYYELLNNGNISISMLMNYIHGGIVDNKILSMDDIKSINVKINNPIVQEQICQAPEPSVPKQAPKQRRTITGGKGR